MRANVPQELRTRLASQLALSSYSILLSSHVLSADFTPFALTGSDRCEKGALPVSAKGGGEGIAVLWPTAFAPAPLIGSAEMFGNRHLRQARRLWAPFR